MCFMIGRFKLDNKERVLIANGKRALAIYEKDGGIYRCVRGLL